MVLCIYYYTNCPNSNHTLGKKLVSAHQKLLVYTGTPKVFPLHTGDLLEKYPTLQTQLGYK